jgi:rSAM-associated Gly-rich repeat protein
LNITTRAGLVGFLLALSALNIPATSATPSPSNPNPTPSIEDRFNRITESIRQRETQLQNTDLPGAELLMAYGWGDGSRGGSFNQAARGGTATTAGGGTFNNAHPYYGGGGGWRDSGGFANGASGGAAWRNY